ncbi:MAG: ErfK/YbiS/YcfS/YnhG family protein [Herbinix sp.]|jgi:vancomycin resistance protein YoaR|nr:ErfK/YbiS/YcfS/YnhG family protein [Herbinix sp.]
MSKINIVKFIKRDLIEKTIIILASIVFLYLLISIYFAKHYFFGTVINGVNVSLRSQEDAQQLIKNSIQDYKLELIERNGATETISGQELGLLYNENNGMFEIFQVQNQFKWITFFFEEHRYDVNNLYTYDESLLKNKIMQLKCLNRTPKESRNVKFKYSNGSYTLVKEVYGNRIRKDRLEETIKLYILMGKTLLDLNQMKCYKDPEYTLSSDKTYKTKYILDKYVSAKITYLFGNKREILDGTFINKWLRVDDNLEVVFNNTAVDNYIKNLSKKYDTVGVTREFKTSTGNVVDVAGGLYGWKINQEEEIKTLLEHINLGRVIEREPMYMQRALFRDEDEIGNTYVEINISKQHLWFYKDGELITQGSVVTGNPNRGNATVLGTYMLNYKHKDAPLIGEDYEVVVTYWMPFFGNQGIHDAIWRRSFGGEIYKRRGSHGCVNAPFHLAKAIYENIEAGIPIIIYEE